MAVGQCGPSRRVWLVLSFASALAGLSIPDMGRPRIRDSPTPPALPEVNALNAISTEARWNDFLEEEEWLLRFIRLGASLVVGFRGKPVHANELA